MPEQNETTNSDDFLSELPNYGPEPAEGVHVGESPIPGFTLKRILRGTTRPIGRIAWSPDGRYLATPSMDGTTQVWDINEAQLVRDLRTSNISLRAINCVAWSHDGKKLASDSGNFTINIWDAETGILLDELGQHKKSVTSISWSPDDKMIASASDDQTLMIWSLETGELLTEFGNHDGWVTSAIWSQDGNLLATGCEDRIIRLWDAHEKKLLRTFHGHARRITNLAWAPDLETIVSTSKDATIRFWNINTGQQIRILEGHGSTIRSVSFLLDGTVLASNSWDSTIRLWRCDNWETIGTINAGASSNWAASLSFNPLKPVLASLSEADSVVCIWEIDSSTLLGGIQSFKPASYTTAKIALVGDSGVGKTGLGWRIAHNEFKEHASTHGQQFWVIDELGKTRADGTECEAVLWDLAGQHVYRPIHSIFLDNVDASLILFDPTNRQDPLKGAQFWLEQLKGKTKLPPGVLVGARSDRGASVLSQQELEQFCQRYGISGGYVSTSAKEGTGLAQLLTILKEQIPWDEMTTTVTTLTFKRIKEFVLSLKEKTERHNVLVSSAELRQELENTDETWQFSDAEMMTAVGHLETHGYVTILNSSSGDQFVLLAPDLLVTLASSIVLLADTNSRELGAVNESELLQGSYPFEELQGLEEAEQQILLDAAVLRFLEHNICFRERLDENILLIFPGLIKQKRPLQDEIPSTDDVSYIVRGRVENIYASLVVLLGYTPSFSRINQWQNQAQYETENDHVCGFRLVEDRDGEIELILYYSDEMPIDERLEFQGLFERFLYQRDVQVTPFPPIVCPDGHPQERAVVVKRQQSGKNFLFCDECGKRIDLPDITEEQTIGLSAAPWLQQEEAMARLRSAYEVDLSRIKGYRRGWSSPRYYLSHLPEQAKWAAKLRHDLSDAGMYLIEKTAQVDKDDFVLILDTPAYQQAFRQRVEALQTDTTLIRTRLVDNSRNLIALVLAGNSTHSHEVSKCQPGNFCDETHYSVSLFDLVLNLYRIPLTNSGFAPLRQVLHQKWEQTLAGTAVLDKKQLQQNRSEFLELLDANFKQNELIDLCFELGIDFENLSGETKKDKARELLQHCQRSGRVEELQTEVSKQRPRIDWPNLLG